MMTVGRSGIFAAQFDRTAANTTRIKESGCEEIAKLRCFDSRTLFIREEETRSGGEVRKARGTVRRDGQCRDVRHAQSLDLIRRQSFHHSTNYPATRHAVAEP
jgi:hypothetical protein